MLFVEISTRFGRETLRGCSFAQFNPLKELSDDMQIDSYMYLYIVKYFDYNDEDY